MQRRSVRRSTTGAGDGFGGAAFDGGSFGPAAAHRGRHSTTGGRDSTSITGANGALGALLDEPRDRSASRERRQRGSVASSVAAPHDTVLTAVTKYHSYFMLAALLPSVLFLAGSLPTRRRCRPVVALLIAAFALYVSESLITLALPPRVVHALRVRWTAVSVWLITCAAAAQNRRLSFPRSLTRPLSPQRRRVRAHRVPDGGRGGGAAVASDQPGAHRVLLAHPRRADVHQLAVRAVCACRALAGLARLVSATSAVPQFCVSRASDHQPARVAFFPEVLRCLTYACASFTVLAWGGQLSAGVVAATLARAAACATVTTLGVGMLISPHAAVTAVLKGVETCPRPLRPARDALERAAAALKARCFDHHPLMDATSGLALAFTSMTLPFRMFTGPVGSRLSLLGACDILSRAIAVQLAASLAVRLRWHGGAELSRVAEAAAEAARDAALGRLRKRLAGATSEAAILRAGVAALLEMYPSAVRLVGPCLPRNSILIFSLLSPSSSSGWRRCGLLRRRRATGRRRGRGGGRRLRGGG